MMPLSGQQLPEQQELRRRVSYEIFPPIFFLIDVSFVLDLFLCFYDENKLVRV